MSTVETKLAASEMLPSEVREYLAAIGRKGGKVGGRSTSKKKQAAVRHNGHKGGRPRKPGTTKDSHDLKD